jgi:hypothetical protein
MNIYCNNELFCFKKRASGFTVCGMLALMLDFFFSEYDSTGSSQEAKDKKINSAT